MAIRNRESRTVALVIPFTTFAAAQDCLNGTTKMGRILDMTDDEYFEITKKYKR